MAALEHIGIAVSNLEDALRVWRDVLGAESYKIESVVEDGIRTHFLRGGTAKIELLEATRSDSAISGFLEKRGAGLHHLAFEVRDLASALERLRSMGYTPLDSAPRQGADGKMIAFLHPRQTAGVLIELCESRGSAYSAKEVVVGGRGRTIREAGRPENPPCLVLGFGDRAEMLGRRLEQRCYVVAVENVDILPAELLRAIGQEKAHIAASGSFVKSAVEAAVGGSAFSLSLLCGSEAAAGTARPGCPVLVLAPDTEENVGKAMAMRSSIGGSLAILPEGHESVLADMIERHVMRSSGRDFFAEK